MKYNTFSFVCKNILVLVVICLVCVVFHHSVPFKAFYHSNYSIVEYGDLLSYSTNLPILAFSTRLPSESHLFNVSINSTYIIPNLNSSTHTQQLHSKQTRNSTISHQQNHYINFTQAISWKAMSVKYKASGKRRVQKVDLTTRRMKSPYFLPIDNKWDYGEYFLYSPESHLITFLRKNVKQPKKVMNDFLFKDPQAYACSIHSAPLPSFIPNTTTIFSKTPSPSSSVWYDRFAIFSTRGYLNIYHNTEWILNFIHYVMNIRNFPLVFDAFTIVNPTHDNATLATAEWNTQFFNAILTVFPPSIRPVYISFKSVKNNTSFFIKRALFISITTPIYDCFQSVQESVLVRKLVYRYCKITVKIDTPKKLHVLYIFRVGNTRQILNEQLLLDSYKNFTKQVTISKTSMMNMTFSKQVKLMSTIDIAFGVHGAGFVNCMFMQPKSGLIEFFAQYFHAYYYMYLTRKTTLFYDMVENNKKAKRIGYEKPSRDSKDANIYVDIPVAYEKMEYMISCVRKGKYGSIK